MSAATDAERPSSAPVRNEPRTRFLGGRDLLVLVGLVTLGALIYGHGVIGHLDSRFLGTGQKPGHDQAQISWFFAWTAFAINNGHNPLFTNYIYAPEGLSLPWATSALLLGLLMFPVTVATSAFVSFNLLALLAPGLAGWSAYLLCREVLDERPSPASVAGGLLFMFSSYIATEAGSHLNLTLVFLVPIFALLAIRRIRGRIGRRAFVASSAAVVAAQLLISSEVLASLMIFGVIALAVYALVGERSNAGLAARTAVEALAGAAIAAIVCWPFFYELARHSGSLVAIQGGMLGLDPANLITTSRESAIPGIGNAFLSAARLSPNVTEQLAYVGLPLIVTLGVFFWSSRRQAIARFCALFMAVVLALALGSLLHLDGEAVNSFPLPWQLIDGLPLVSAAITVRFALFLWLAIVVAVAWLVREGGTLRWILYGLTIVSLLPNAVLVTNATAIPKPRLMTDHQLLASTIPGGSTVISAPFGYAGTQMAWQIESDFHFKLVGGYGTSNKPLPLTHYTRLVDALEQHRIRGRLRRPLCRLIHNTGASFAIADPGKQRSWHVLRNELGLEPSYVGGLLVFDLRSVAAPGGACA